MSKATFSSGGSNNTNTPQQQDNRPRTTAPPPPVPVPPTTQAPPPPIESTGRRSQTLENIQSTSGDIFVQSQTARRESVSLQESVPQPQQPQTSLSPMMDHSSRKEQQLRELSKFRTPKKSSVPNLERQSSRLEYSGDPKKSKNLQKSIDYIHQGLSGDSYYEQLDEPVSIERNNSLFLSAYAVTRNNSNIETNSFLHTLKSPEKELGRLTATNLHEFGAHVLHPKVVMKNEQSDRQDHAFMFNKNEPFNENNIYLGWGRKVFNAIQGTTHKEAFTNEFFRDITERLKEQQKRYKNSKFNQPSGQSDSSYDRKMADIGHRRDSMLEAIKNPDPEKHPWLKK